MPTLSPRALLLAAVFALGVALRCWHLDDALLWHDEVATRVFATGHTPEAWLAALYDGRVHTMEEVRRFQRYDGGFDVLPTITGLAKDDPQHPPLYYIAARAWVAAFGDSVSALRSLSVVTGVALLPSLAWAAWELFRTRRAAWTAAALAASSPFFVLYAQEAREYALWSALVALHAASLLRAVRISEEPSASARRQVAAWSWYALITAVALYTSFSTTGPILAHIVFIAGRARLRPDRTSLSAAAAMAVAAVSFAPWALALSRHYEAFAASMRWSKEIVIPNSSLLRIQAFNASRSVIDLWPELDNGAAWVATALALALFASALLHVARRERRDAALLVLLIVALPVGLMLGPDLLYGGIRSVSARYMTPAWLGLLLALAAWLSAVPRREPLLALVLAVGLGSAWHNAGQPTVWTKGTSVGLPAIAALVNAQPTPLVVGGMESHSPGSLMALANLLRDDAHMQLRTIEEEEAWRLPADKAIFLLNPIPPYREAMERRDGVTTRRVYHDLFLELWVVERPTS